VTSETGTNPYGDVADTPEARAQIRVGVRAGLERKGLAGYVAFTPSNVTYLSGYVSYFLSNWWRMHGTVLCAIDTAGHHEPRLVLGDAEEGSARSSVRHTEVDSYPMWVETRGYAGIQQAPPAGEPQRPAQWRETDLDVRFRDALGGLGLLEGRVGTDLRFITHDTYRRLRRIAPDVEWVDATDLMYETRAVKLPFEVARLRAAAELAEAGMAHAAGSAGKGSTLAEIRAHFHEGVAVHARSDARYAGFSDLWVIPGMGSQATIAAHADQQGLEEGDLLKFDCGTTVGGYRSDSGRTFVLGAPSPEAAELYEHLREAHARAVGAIGPGVPASRVYEVASAAMQAAGYPGYRRGHFGHSLGLDTFHEEPPFLAPGDATRLQPGMVLAVETPFYGPDLGPVMIEDLVLVTDAGHEYLTGLPRTLEPAGAPG
jgi:Xaa-Pro aminopeptidase